VTRASHPPSIQHFLRSRLVQAGIVVVLGAALVQFAHAVSLRREAARQRLAMTAQLSAAQIAEFIALHQAAVALYAERRANEPDWPRGLGAVRARYPAFLTMLVAGRDGRVIHGVPAFPDGSGQWAGRPVGDRAYFRVPMASGRPYVSDAFRGRAFGRVPIVAISAPVLDAQGRPQAIVEGSIPADAFAARRTQVMAQGGRALLVLDRQRRVVHAGTGLAFAPLQRLDVTLPAPVTRVRGLQLLPGAYADGSDAFVASATTSFGWTVLVLEPTALLYGELRRDALNLLVPALLALAVAAWAAGVLARRLAGPIHVLAEHMRDYDVERARTLALPRAPAEVIDLADAFNRLGQRLREAFAANRDALLEQRRLAETLQRTVEERERVIAERTEALSRANSELRMLSTTDALTGCANYRGFTEGAAVLWAHAAERGLTLSAFACDIDHFKLYNDRLGHPAGDACLRRVAAALRAVMHGTADVVARVGGEEFLVLMTGLSREQAAAVAQRLHGAVAALAMPHPGGGTVSVSVGWAHRRPESDGTLETLLAEADAALYRAKAAGRDRVAA